MRRKENDQKPVVPSLHHGPVLCETRQPSRTEKRLGSIPEATAEFYGIWNRSSGPIQLNEGQLSLLGYSEAYSSKRQVFLQNLLHADDRADFGAQLDAYLAGKTKTSLLDCEFRLRTKAGQYRRFQLRGQTVRRDRRGTELEMAYSIRDVHACKEQHEDMLASRDGFAAILQGSSDIICVVEPAEFRLMAFNKSFEEMILRVYGVRARPGIAPEGDRSATSRGVECVLPSGSGGRKRHAGFRHCGTHRDPPYLCSDPRPRRARLRNLRFGP